MAKRLEQADWCDIQRILKETFDIWSPGLSREKYINFIWRQMQHPWSKRNYSYLILRDGKGSPTPAASLKYYRLRISSKGISYPFIGLGAIYTRKDLRGRGFATDLIKLVLDKASSEGNHGVILFSDIPPSFYREFGFYDLNNEKFILTLSDQHQSPPTQEGSSRGSSPTGDTVAWRRVVNVDGAAIAVNTKYLTTERGMIDFVTKHYRRWLRGQPYGLERSSTYFHFKVFRENYLADNSVLAWPRLELLTREGDDQSGYAIIEHGGRVLRILELVGNSEERRILWNGIFARAQDLQAIRISGWESILTDLIPGFSLAQFSTFDDNIRYNCKSLMFADKIKGRSMLLPFNPELKNWLTICPCPFLELDHL